MSSTDCRITDTMKRANILARLTLASALLIAFVVRAQPIGAVSPGLTAVNDQVIPDDLIVQVKLCVGLDCVNNEDFGDDAIRLKENNLRIAFNDTSVGAFPSNDWQLQANDSASGGANKFAIVDQTVTRTLFTVLAGAPDDAVVIDSSGKLGLGTSAPAVDLHLVTGMTPSLRLEQTPAGGFAAQTWDIVGDHTGFAVRDATGGGALPFQIHPGAPTSSIDIGPSGNVGIGLAGPTERLHVNGDAFIAGHLRARDTVQVDGIMVELSDSGAKTRIEPVNGAHVLERLLTIPISTWRYKTDATGEWHMGVMAQHFFAVFGLGNDDKHIAALDVNGVLMAALQEIDQRLRGQHAQVKQIASDSAELRGDFDTLEKRLEALERAR